MMCVCVREKNREVRGQTWTKFCITGVPNISTQALVRFVTCTFFFELRSGEIKKKKIKKKKERAGSVCMRSSPFSMVRLYFETWKCRYTSTSRTSLCHAAKNNDRYYACGYTSYVVVYGTGEKANTRGSPLFSFRQPSTNTYPQKTLLVRQAFHRMRDFTTNRMLASEYVIVF